jgi:hypothetical protein
MAHFAKLDENNVVIDVNVVDNVHLLDANGVEHEALGVAYLIEWSGGYTNWKQTSYNRNFRKNYAVIGGVYDPVRDAFIPPKVYNSWFLDEDSCVWKAPFDPPSDGNEYIWDEATLSYMITISAGE